ncbi:hypothetical protein AGR7A_Lc10010 [Agrobacterium deltaense NCPPB 1641]|uniref:Uncharacterized protein n=1 Tax=Agrobacterium deltaense NCPPB 1641 TaxID=1183425 RepID=A0A1S7TRS9_9HYPH|nr:hypothetical protein AGR7A_Lc10010 [Agrobacterium deltaense NCPPB 1641]
MFKVRGCGLSSLSDFLELKFF